MLIEKTESDDELIDALRQEMALLRQENTRLQERLAREEYASSSRVEVARPGERKMAEASTEAELSRLRRLCKQQVRLHQHLLLDAAQMPVGGAAEYPGRGYTQTEIAEVNDSESRLFEKIP